MSEIIGWSGSIFYILAYFLLSIKKLQAHRPPYQVLNILGGVCLVISSWELGDHPSVFLNSVWAAIGLFAILYNKKSGKD